MNAIAVPHKEPSHPKITFLADMFAKALSPPPYAITNKCEFFFSSCIKVFLKLDETDDFVIKKIWL